MAEAAEDEAAARAIKHLDQAVLLAPQDLSIHQGRLHVFMLAGRYHEMARPLEQSVKLYKGPDDLDAWLAYPNELFGRREFQAAVELLLVLDRFRPNDHRIAGNLSAAYGMLEQDERALAWARKAVELAPDDPIDNWNLARLYDFTGKLELADAAYRKSLALQSGEMLKESTCAFAEFLRSKKNDAKKACELQKKGGCSPSACR